MLKELRARVRDGKIVLDERGDRPPEGAEVIVVFETSGNDRQRIAGLSSGGARMSTFAKAPVDTLKDKPPKLQRRRLSPDFDAPLPDEFWNGKP